MQINDLDCDVEEPEQADFWDSPGSAQYVIGQARLSATGRKFNFASFQVF